MWPAVCQRFSRCQAKRQKALSRSFGTSLSDPKTDPSPPHHHHHSQRAEALGGGGPGRARRGVATWGKRSGLRGAGRPERTFPGRRRRRRERPDQQRVKGRGRGLSRVIGQIMCSKQKVCVCVPVSHCIGSICTTLSLSLSPHFSLHVSPSLSLLSLGRTYKTATPTPLDMEIH